MGFRMCRICFLVAISHFH